MDSRAGRPLRRQPGKFYDGLIRAAREFAEHEFRLSNNGLREHLEAVWRQTGKRPAQLDGPALPDCVRHVWGWFLDLHGSRGEGGINYAELLAWAQLNELTPTPFEIRLLRELDRAFLAYRVTQLKGA